MLVLIVALVVMFAVAVAVSERRSWRGRRGFSDFGGGDGGGGDGGGGG